MKTAFAIVIGFFILLAFIVFCHGKTPTPITGEGVDFSKITDIDIAKTIAHRNALETELHLTLAAEATTLRAAVEAATQAQVSLQTYEKKVEDLAAENAMNYSAKLNGEKIIAEQKTALLRRDGIITGIGLLIAAYLFCKFYLHLPI